MRRVLEGWTRDLRQAARGMAGRVAPLASYVPARRASAVDPMVALRAE